MKKTLLIILTILTIFTLVACNNKANSSSAKNNTTQTQAAKETVIETVIETVKETVEETVMETTKEAKKETKGGNTVKVEMSIKNYGIIELELYKDDAPITVDNFVKLVKKGFYDGLTFHRIIEGFMMQGGDPLGNGTGGSDQNIKGEFAANGIKNDLSHERGVISMARSNHPDSASSQFFIMHKDGKFLDGNYAAFGRVTSGIEVVDEVCTTAEPTDGNGTIPKDQQPVIEYIKIIE